VTATTRCVFSATPTLTGCPRRSRAPEEAPRCR
jgi:hypothetical protein